MQTVYISPKSVFPAELPSNTLFGAICSAMSDLGLDPGVLVDTYRSSPPFLLSSAFPYARSGDTVSHFFPVPAGLFFSSSHQKSYEKLKKMKDIRFVHENIFRDIISGNIAGNDILQNLDDRYVIRDKCLYPSETAGGKWERKPIEVPHNHINRMSMQSEGFFHTYGSVYGSGGLFFLLDFRDSNYEKEVRSALRLLEDRGFGPKVSAGQGQFSLSYGEIQLPEAKDGRHLLTFSRFLPGDFSGFGREVWYDLIPIQGRSSDGFMKKKVIMLREGSVFRDTGQDFYGSIAEVRDNPRTVEYGVAMTVKMKRAG